jgi:hypothetical protein
LLRKFEGKIPIIGYRREWKNNIKMDLKKEDWRSVLDSFGSGYRK